MLQRHSIVNESPERESEWRERRAGGSRCGGVSFTERYDMVSLRRKRRAERRLGSFKEGIEQRNACLCVYIPPAVTVRNAL